MTQDRYNEILNLYDQYQSGLTVKDYPEIIGQLLQALPELLEAAQIQQ